MPRQARQPQRPRATMQDPLLRGCRGLWTFAEGVGRDLIGSATLTGGTPVVGPLGRAAEGQAIGPYTQTTAPPLTLLWWGIVAPATNTYMIRVHQNSSYVYNLEVAAGFYRYRGINLTALGVAARSDWHVAVVTQAEDRKARLYLNGQPAGAPTAPIYAPVVTPIQVWVDGASLALAGVWDRALSAAEVARISDDPWRLVRRREPAWWPSGAAPPTGGLPPWIWQRPVTGSL